MTKLIALVLLAACETAEPQAEQPDAGVTTCTPFPVWDQYCTPIESIARGYVCQVPADGGPVIDPPGLACFGVDAYGVTCCAHR